MTLLRLLLSLSFLGVFAEGAPTYFRLYLPDLFDTPFDKSGTVIEVPCKISIIRILVVDSDSRRMDASSYRILINGKGSGNVFDTRGSSEGSLLEMTESTLSRRPDALFDTVENTIEVLAKDRRGRQYYQNWVLRNTKRVGPSMFPSSTTISSEDPGGVPPDLILTEPAAAPRFGLSDQTLPLTVKGILSASSPGTTLYVNGKPAAGPAPAATWRFSLTTTMERTSRELVLEAVDKKRNTRRVTIPVLVDQKKPTVFRFPGQKYALIIGVSRHGSSPEAPPALETAAPDARAFSEVLKTAAGFSESNIRLLLDEYATPDQVRIAFSDFLAKAATDDLLVVYLAGRGLHDPRLGRPHNLYLALYGTQLSNLDLTALPLFDLELMLNRSVRCNRTFLIFDVGHALSQEWQFAGRNLVNNHLLNLFSEQQGRSVLVSGSADEISLPAQTGLSAGGLFTRWLSTGLAGDADLDNDGTISGSELFQFVSAKVRTESDGRQNPRFRLASPGKGGAPQ